MKGIILAAGMGTRLRPLTDVTPKCLVPVNGKPMLEYQLECLARAGLPESVLIVGYRADQIISRIGNYYQGMAISYVKNPLFQETNNLYSLWLARDYLDDDIILTEADLLYEDDLIRELVQHPAQSVAVVDRYRPPMDGTVILAENNIANALVLKVNQGPGFSYKSALKTVNIYKLSRSAMRNLVLPELSAFVEAGRIDQYYEAIFGDLLAQKRLRMSVLGAAGFKWAEVDTREDLSAAEELFGRQARVAGLPALSR
ncbi:MAG: phosphocholine cytidylyltransferase family protein [Chloroflexi bacterium]|nr:phosphocholine cytidylyltransferase family protein [Chloroflexota bacterium]